MAEGTLNSDGFVITPDTFGGVLLEDGYMIFAAPPILPTPFFGICHDFAPLTVTTSIKQLVLIDVDITQPKIVTRLGVKPTC